MTSNNSCKEREHRERYIKNDKNQEGICHGFLDIKIDLPWFILYDVHHPRGVKNEEQMEDGVFGFKFNEIGTSEFQTKDFGTKKKSVREQFGLLERTQRRIF